MEYLMKRREAKDVHEKTVLDSFKTMLAKEGRVLSILERPDPPDAIVDIDGNKSWIEITEAMFNKDYARNITSFPPDDAAHVYSEQNLLGESEETFEQNVIKVVSKKYEKASIRSIYSTNGSGILLVGLFSPFVDIEVINDLSQVVSEIVRNNDARFNQVYFYDRAHNFYKVV